jgi:glycosyltransferase involved in cell wall biosynthesis
MKILFFTHYTNLHGANKSMLCLLEQLIKEGFEILVICPERGHITRALEIKKIRFIVCNFYNWMTPESEVNPIFSIEKLIKNYFLLFKLTKIVKRENIDLIYSNSSCVQIGLLLSKKNKLPHIWHIREFGFDDFSLKYDFGKKYFKYYLGQSSEIVAISEAIKNRVLIGMEAKTRVVYNGVFSLEQVNEFRCKREERYKKQKHFTFCIIGQITKSKNQEEAIKAFSVLKLKYPNAKLLIVGNNNNYYGDKLKNLVFVLKLKRSITFTGYVDNPYEVLFKSDALLMCSRNEAMGRVTAEAMASGIPVIGFNSGGTSEIITNGFNGLLYDEKTIKLVSQMEYLILNQNNSKKIGLNGFNTAIDKFSVEVYAKNIIQILNNYK